MKRRALLIGSQTGGLSGVDNDVAFMAELLTPFGFKIDSCTGSNATRAGILARYRRLIQDTQAADAALVYYSGHGCALRNKDYRPMTESTTLAPRYFGYIVPFDYEDSKLYDFRGILSVELSVLLAELTEKTRNVTVILDCCHAARMSRDSTMTPKALPMPVVADTEAYGEYFKTEGIRLDLRHAESNPNAVRLVAAGPSESAYEYTNAKGRRIGVLTEAFGLVLREAGGLPVTWNAIGQRVRERVLAHNTLQRPEVEGPAGRRLFSLDTPEKTGVLSYFNDQGRPSLRGGRILGVNVGDVYAIMPLTAEDVDPKQQLARATVTQVAGAVSRVALSDEAVAHLPNGVPAFPVKVAFRKRKVAVEAEGETRQTLAQAINASPHTCVAETGDTEPILASVRVAAGRLELQDTFGALMVSPAIFTPDAVRKVVDNLQLMARAQAVRELGSGTGPNALGDPFEATCGRVVAGRPEPLPDEPLCVGERIYVRMHNQGKRTLYAWVFDVGLGDRISLLTKSGPSGIEVKPGEDYVVGYLEFDGLVGLRLGWPEVVPKQEQRHEFLVVILSDVRQNLSALQTTGVKSLESRSLESRGRKSLLQQLLEQVDSGNTRDLQDDDELHEEARYAVKQFTFLVQPPRDHGA